jgi:hypothetical protein
MNVRTSADFVPRSLVYHHVLPPKGCYYIRESDERDYSPSDYENLRITCRQVKNEIEQEAMSDIATSIAAVTQFTPMMIRLLGRRLHTWTLVKTPSTYKESLTLDITLAVPLDASPFLIDMALSRVGYSADSRTHMRALTIRYQFDEKETKDVNLYLSAAWHWLGLLTVNCGHVKQLRLELIWHARDGDELWTNGDSLYQSGQLGRWSYTMQAMPGGEEERRLRWSWPEPPEDPPL